MAGRTFLDTNVLVYLFAGDEPRKQGVVRGILRDGARDRNLVVSTQVMQECYSVLTGKFRKTVTPDQAEASLRRLMEFEVVVLGPDLVVAAASRSRKETLSIWDALIVEAALHSGCSVLLSEDLQEGRVFGGLRVENPFRP